MGVGEVNRFENGADKDESLGNKKAFHGKKGSTTTGSVPIKAGERAQCVLTGLSGCQGTQEGRELQPGKAKIDKGERCMCRRVDGGSLPTWGFPYRRTGAERM